MAFDIVGDVHGHADRLRSMLRVLGHLDGDGQWIETDRSVLFGHYWWRRGDAEAVHPKATCVDYSVAKGGALSAYRWDGEADLDPAKLVFA